MTTWIRRRAWFVIVACIVLMAVIVTASQHRAHAVLVTEAHTGDLLLRIAASGLVETQSADLSFRSAGQIVGVYVDEGDTVAQSDLLARLAGTGAHSLSPALGPAGGAADVGEVIQAPYDGTVIGVYLRTGEVVAPGQPVLRIGSSQPPWVTAFIDSEDAAHLVPGDALRCRAGGYLSQPWDVVVRSVGVEAVPRADLAGSARQVRVRCDVVDPSFGILPGAEVDVDGEIAMAQNVVLVPTAAVTHDGPHDSVFIVEGRKAVRREVTLGGNNFDLMQIRDGIVTGETVVVNGKEGLRDGMRIRTKPMPEMASSLSAGGE